jgi:hypothetical protein
MAAVQIINNGASLKIITDGVARYITKYQIREIAIVRDTIIKLDTGEGPLYNVFIDFADVTAPAVASVDALRDAINDMLQTNLAGFATESKQTDQIAQINTLQNSVNDLNTKIGTVNDKILYQPALVDEANPNSVYEGYANPGVKTSDPVWAIRKTTNTKGLLSYKWAAGNKNFDKVWDNRATLVYS